MSPPGQLADGPSPTLLLLILLIAAVSGLGYMGYVAVGQAEQVKQQKKELALSQQRVGELRAKDEELTQRLAALERERRGLEERIAALQGELGASTEDLERSRAKLTELTHDYERVVEDRTKVQTQLAAVTSERDESRKRVHRLEQDNAEFQRSTERLRERLNLLDRDYRQLADQLAQIEANPTADLEMAGRLGSEASAAILSESTFPHSSAVDAVELPPIIVRTDRIAVSAPILGRLLEINDPHRFVVIDAGSADGVRVGMVFNVLRGGSRVGRITAVRVRPDLTACDLLGPSAPGPLRIGDLVVQGGP